jgi:hypothetical protein
MNFDSTNNILTLHFKPGTTLEYTELTADELEDLFNTHSMSIFIRR